MCISCWKLKGSHIWVFIYNPCPGWQDTNVCCRSFNFCCFVELRRLWFLLLKFRLILWEHNWNCEISVSLRLTNWCYSKFLAFFWTWTHKFSVCFTLFFVFYLHWVLGFFFFKLLVSRQNEKWEFVGLRVVTWSARALQSFSLLWFLYDVFHHSKDISCSHQHIL